MEENIMRKVCFMKIYSIYPLEYLAYKYDCIGFKSEIGKDM